MHTSADCPTRLRGESGVAVFSLAPISMPVSPVSAAVAEYLAIEARPARGFLIARWLRPVTAQELQRGYAAALHVARDKRYWLLDLRGRGPASEDDTHWVLTQFVPQLAPQLGGRTYLAFLVAATQLSPEQQENGFPMVLDDRAHVRLFAAEEPALRWLLGRQHHDSA